MELSDDLFADIRRTLGLEGGDGSETDGPPIASGNSSSNSNSKGGSAKRRANRSDASRARAEIEVPGMMNQRKRVTLIDLSRGGVAFFDAQPWAPGTKMVLHLPRSPEHVIPLLCMVRNSRVVQGYFRVGVEFVTHYDSGSGGIALTRDPAERAAGTVEIDKGRRATRTRFNRAAAPAQLHTYDMDTAGRIVEGDVVDLSEGGVGLVCQFQLPPGRKLMVRMTPPGQKTMTRMCEVVSCRRNDSGGYRIGTRFVEYKPSSSSSRSLPQTLVGWFRAKG
jgi:hypothetical protein